MPFKLKDIEANEVSFVEAGAIKREFLFKKSDETNNTLTDGYVVCPECDHRETITDFIKSADEECSLCGANLIDSDAEIIFKGENTMEELVKALVKFLGGEDELDEDEIEEIEKQAGKLAPEAVSALKGAVNILNKYKEKFPGDIKKAIDVLAKAAINAAGTAKSLTDEEIKKAGAKLSKSTLDVIKKVVSSAKDHSTAIKALEAFLKGVIKKGEGVEELEERMEKLLTKIEKLESGEPEDEETDEEKEDEDVEDEEKEEIKKKKKGVKKSITEKIADALETLSNRLEKIEKRKGIKKSIEGDEEIEDEETEDEETQVIDEKTGKIKKQKTHRWGFKIAKKQS